MLVGGPQYKRSRGWVMLRREGLRWLRELQAAGEIRSADVSVLLAAVEHLTLESGVVEGGARAISELQGMPSEVPTQYALRRLETADLLRRVGKRRSRYPRFVVSPVIASSAKETHRAWHWRAWAQLEDAELPPPPTASVIKAGIA